MGGAMMDPVGVLAASVHHAVLIGLNPEQHKVYRFDGGVRIDTGNTEERRPRIDSVDVVMFPQTWGSTALGFGGVGGQAITTAYTVVVYGPMGDACVYFGGRFAYHIARHNATFQDHFMQRNMHKVAGATALYESQP